MVYGPNLAPACRVLKLTGTWPRRCDAGSVTAFALRWEVVGVTALEELESLPGPFPPTPVFELLIDGMMG